MEPPDDLTYNARVPSAIDHSSSSRNSSIALPLENESSHRPDKKRVAVRNYTLNLVNQTLLRALKSAASASASRPSESTSRQPATHTRIHSAETQHQASAYARKMQDEDM